MAEAATHLVDEVFPEKPMRQWVLTFPFHLRFLFAREPKIKSWNSKSLIRNLTNSWKQPWQQPEKVIT